MHYLYKEKTSRSRIKAQRKELERIEDIGTKWGFVLQINRDPVGPYGNHILQCRRLGGGSCFSWPSKTTTKTEFRIQLWEYCMYEKYCNQLSF